MYTKHIYNNALHHNTGTCECNYEHEPTHYVMIAHTKGLHATMTKLSRLKTVTVRTVYYTGRPDIAHSP